MICLRTLFGDIHQDLPMTDFQAARLNMVESQVRCNAVTDTRVEGELVQLTAQETNVLGYLIQQLSDMPLDQTQNLKNYTMKLKQ